MIVLDDVSKTYLAGTRLVRVLSSVSLAVKEGEYVAIMGASGSGKSTLLNVLGLLDHYDSGRYLLNGQLTHDLDDESAALLRSRTIGFIFQSFNLLPQKRAWENVALPLRIAGVGARERERRANELLERLGLDDRADHFPNELSGGQRQRVAAARALALDPPVILADEPTGNLDSATAREVLQLIRGLKQDGRTVVMVTHERSVADAADRTVYVQDGVVSNLPDAYATAVPA